MADKKENRELLFDDDIRQKFLEGAKMAYDAAARSYGPKGLNAALEKGFGKPIYTRDGITILRDVFSSDRAKNMGIQTVVAASEESNLVAGDGSTAVALLTYHLLHNSIQAIAAGQHPMDISDILNNDSYALLKKLKELVIPVKDEQLKDVATVSCGDPLIGQLIAEAILYVGPDGGILTEKAPITEIEREYVDGYYLQSGFQALQAGKKELIEPFVIVSAKRLSSSADAIELLNKTVESKFVKQGQIPRIVFIGNIEDMAYQTIVNTVNAGQIDAVIIKTPPMYGELGKFLLDDIALYAGCELITETTSLKQFNANYIGTLDKVIASKSETTLFGDNKTEAVQERIKQIKSQIETEEVPAVSEKLRDRVAKLEGKIAIFKIGAPQEQTKEELVFRIEDAINSTRHAYAEGIVPGGGVTLLELSKIAELSDISRKSLRQTFQQLLINANFPEQLKLDEALKAKPGYGYNLKKSDKLVDVIREGVLDPYRVIKEVITHSISQAAETIKLGLGVIFTDEE